MQNARIELTSNRASCTNRAMDTPNVAGSAPTPAPAAEPTPVVSPVTPQAPTSSLTSANEEFKRVAAAAKTPAELRQAIEVLRQAQQAKPTQPTPAKAEDGNEAAPAPATPPSEPIVEPAAPSEAPPAAPEGDTPAEPTPEPETPTPAEPPADLDEVDRDDDSPVTATTAKRARVQLPENDELGRLTVSFQKRNRDWTLEQAMTAAKEKLGLNKPADPAAPPPPESTLPKTVDAVNQAIADLRAQKKAAAAELQTERVAELDDQIFDLAQHRTQLERQEEKQVVQQAQAYERDFTKSEARAVELFEFAGKPDSPGGKRMIEIEEALRETGDPRWHDPNKPLLIAQMVAREMNIPPRSKKAAAPAPAAAPATAQPKKQVLPTGASRTTPVTAPVNETAKRFEGIKTMKDLQEVYRSLGIPT